MNWNADFPEDMAAGKLHSDASNPRGVFGKPKTLPRVGKKYQVEIPPYTENQPDGADPWDSIVGLPIPIRWANLCGNTTKKLAGSSSIASSSREPESSSNVILDDGKLENVSIEKQPKGELAGSCLVPDDVLDSWSKIERASFLLALYIFEKNFVHVKKFVQTKRNSDIMAYYYGEFYRSDEYYRWSDGRRVKSRKCVYGEKIFTGSRLQELLSRLLRNMSAERQTELLQVSKKFAEGKLLLEEYVFTLKRIVGMNSLIEAVGIGKGKQDLTNVALELTKCNYAVTLRSELPIGKACSSLTRTEIIKYLTGGYRLSKARSNDLFWEAVWPRLLARGWHSEQPKHMANAAAGSKHSLVFLLPDVQKFSRKLVKGNHYFDSVTDVLRKVASEPLLLDLDTEDHEANKNQEENEGHHGTNMENEGNHGANVKTEGHHGTNLENEGRHGTNVETEGRHVANVESGGNHGANVENDSLPMMRRQSYLQPRNPNQHTDVVKLTVVDSSLCGDKPYEVRDYSSSSTQTHSEESGKDIQKASTGTPESVDTMLLDRPELICADPNTSLCHGNTSSEKKRLEIGAINLKIRGVGNQEVHPMIDADTYEDAESKKVAKPSEKVKKDVDNIAPITKRRRRLTACSRTLTSNTSASKVELVIPSSCSTINDKPASNTLPFQDKMSSTSSPKSSLSVSTECVPVNNVCVAEVSPVESQPRVLIDLNVIPDSPDSEIVLSVIEMTEEQTDSEKKPESHCELKGDDNSDQQQPPSMSSRRHSTRTGPPTKRALEAFAWGFRTVNKKQKNKEAVPRAPSDGNGGTTSGA